MMRNCFGWRLSLLGSVFCLASCAATDPLQRDGLWRPNNANEQNLRVMVVNQRDLLRGRGEPGADGAYAAAAIRRLNADKVKALEMTNTQSSGGGGSGGGGGSSGSP